MQDTVPDWITHLAIVNDGQVRTGPKDEMLLYKDQVQNATSAIEEPAQVVKQESGEPVVEMKHVGVTYGPRKVGVVPSWYIKYSSPRQGPQKHHLDDPPRRTLPPPGHQRYARSCSFSLIFTNALLSQAPAKPPSSLS
jgi:hypothetical protein